MKSLLPLLLACICATYVAAQLRNDRFQKATVPTRAGSANDSRAIIRKESANGQPRLLGSYEAQWKNADGTVMHQTLNLRKLPERNFGGAPANRASRLKAEIKSSVTEDQGNCFTCTTEEKRVSLSDNTFMTVDHLSQASHIYPGAIYRFDNYANGSWQAEENNRNPIVVNATVYNTTGKNYEDVRDPSAATIGNAIANLFRRFSTDPDKISNGSMQFTAYEVESQADVMVKVGASGHGFGYYAKNLFQFNDKEHRRFILIDCTKEMFTINTTAPANGFFSDASRQSGDMMFISSVTYGVRILACMEIETRERTIADKFEGGGSWGVAGGQIDVDVLSREFNTANTTKMYVVGGPSNEVFPVYSYDDLKSRCTEIARNTTYHTVQPIKYQLENMDGGVVTSSSATDYFKVRSCSCHSDSAMEITARITNMKTLGNNTDAELYGEIWAQVLDAKGKEIMPVDGKDRLFSVGQEAHLNADQLRGTYNPQISARFRIPADKKAGARLIIFYWMMEYNTVGGDDFLHMQNSYQLPYNRNNTKYYVSETRLDDASDGSKTSRFTADGEGTFDVTTSVSKKPISQ